MLSTQSSAHYNIRALKDASSMRAKSSGGIDTSVPSQNAVQPLSIASTATTSKENAATAVAAASAPAVAANDKVLLPNALAERVPVHLLAARRNECTTNTNIRPPAPAATLTCVRSMPNVKNDAQKTYSKQSAQSMSVPVLPTIAGPAGTDASTEIDDTYQLLNKLGEGAYGKVYRARDRSTGQQVAIKKIKVSGKYNGVPDTTLREIAVLKELNHVNVVRLYHVMYKETRDLHLVFEYLEYDLCKYMKICPNGLPPKIVQSYMFQLLSGIEFCHSRRIIHRDLKPVNLLVNQRGYLKIADFGLARCFNLPFSHLTSDVVTLWYRAPEVLLGAKTYNVSIDMWSIGCIFAEMIGSKPIFSGDSEIEQIFQIFSTMGTPDSTVWPGINTLKDWKPIFPKWKPKNIGTQLPQASEEAMRLIKNLLVYFPGWRISARQALRHEYFADIDADMYRIAAAETIACAKAHTAKENATAIVAAGGQKDLDCTSPVAK